MDPAIPVDDELTSQERILIVRLIIVVLIDLPQRICRFLGVSRREAALEGDELLVDPPDEPEGLLLRGDRFPVLVLSDCHRQVEQVSRHPVR